MRSLRKVRVAAFLTDCLPVFGTAQLTGQIGEPPQLRTRPAAASNDPAVADQNRVTLDLHVEDSSGGTVTRPGLQDLLISDNKKEIRALHTLEGVNASTEIVLAIDTLNGTPEEVARTLQAIAQYLNLNGGRLPHPVSILWITTSPDPKGSNTAAQDPAKSLQDKQAFVHMIAASRNGMELKRKLDESVITANTILSLGGGESASQRVRLSLQGLDVLASAEIERPGRKLVLWIGPGWPLLSQSDAKTREQLFDFVVYMYGQLQRARVIVYAVDAQGGTAAAHDYQYLVPRNPLSSRQSAPSAAGGDSDSVTSLKLPQNARQVSPNDLAVQVLELQTGGLLLMHNNDLLGQIEKCAAEADFFVSASFDPPVSKTGGEYHAIEVRSTDRRLRIRTRAAYYLQP